MRLILAVAVAVLALASSSATAQTYYLSPQNCANGRCAPATVVLSEDVVGGTSGNGGFTLAATEGAVTTTYSSSPNASTRTYSLSRTIYQFETVNLSYNPGNIEDLAGNGLGAISNQTVTNNSTQSPPPPPPALNVTSAAGVDNSNSITVNFDGIVNGHDGFTLTRNGNGVGLTYGAGDDGTSMFLVFSAGENMLSGDNVRLAYTPGNVAGLASFSDYSVSIV